jgi:hypothetical protein
MNGALGLRLTIGPKPFRTRSKSPSGPQEELLAEKDSASSVSRQRLLAADGDEKVTLRVRQTVWFGLRLKVIWTLNGRERIKVLLI